MSKLFPGILMCLIISTPAWLLGRIFPVIGGPVFGILLGMLIALIKKPKTFDIGVKYTSKKLLQYSVILLGFDMNLYNVIKVGSQSMFVIIFTLSISFLVAFLVGRALKVSQNIAILIGVGTSICGGSAIAATAPIIGAEDEEIANCISTIFLFNVLAVFIFPPLGHLFGLSDNGFGMWAGTAINDTSSVVAAGSSWSSMVGNDVALQFATIVKLTRTLMIVPITLVLAIYISTKATKPQCKQNFSFVKTFPWFVIAFLVAAVVNTFSGIPVEASHYLSNLGKFIIIMAMVAIGVNTNIKKLVLNGHKSIILGLFCWFSVAITSLIVQLVTGLW